MLGVISTLCFAFLINEVKLVKESKEKYDKYFFIQEEEVNDRGVLLDLDNSEWDQKSKNPFIKKDVSESEYSSNQEFREPEFNIDNHSLSDFFDEAREIANKRERAVSVGGRNEWLPPRRYIPSRRQTTTPLFNLGFMEPYFIENL